MALLVVGMVLPLPGAWANDLATRIAGELPVASSPGDARLNVVLILSDDQPYDALGAAGHPVLRTPGLDRLAGQGVRFSHTFVTLPICTPARAALLTGRFAQSNGVTFFGQRIGEDVPCWPRLMSEAGYQTAITGKWHNARGPDHYGFEWQGNMFMRGMGSYTDPPLIERRGEPQKTVIGNITELFTDAALRFLAERDTSRPFFLYVAYTAPHDPREPPPEYEAMYEPEAIPLQPNFMPQPRFDPGTLDIRDEKLLPMPREPEAVRRELARYYGLITHMDAQIGRILEALERTGLARETIVIFAGDNGLAIGAHGLLGKQTLYEEGVRVPLIIRHPRLTPAGHTRPALIYLVDLMPTVFEWTGLPLPPGVEGRSLARIYTGEQERVRDAVFCRYDERDDPRFRSIRTERYKLIRHLKLDREELFDLEEDPYELRDLSDDLRLAAVRQELRARLRAHLEAQGDTVGLSNWP